MAAGWKLRKDKAPAETPGAETETPRTESFSAETHLPQAPFVDAVPGVPDFDAEPDSHFSSVEFDHEMPGPADGPLTLVDYTTGDDEAVPQEPHAQIYEMPSAGETVFAMPPPETTEQPETAEHTLGLGQDTDFETIPASSSWLSSDFSADTPAVAPFVLDTPAPPAAPPAAPQIVVHIGRMSAPFDLIKDVTTIGRPDSALHYYPDVEIEMDDAVSRRHCEIVKREAGYYLVDTGSTNGTRLNGETLLPHQEHLLARGDRIHLGDRTEITFE